MGWEGLCTTESQSLTLSLLSRCLWHLLNIHSDCILSDTPARFFRYPGWDPTVTLQEEVPRSESTQVTLGQNSHLSGHSACTLHSDTLSGLTQQSTTTESFDHFLGFHLKALTPRAGLHPTLPGDDLNRVHTLRPGQAAM